MGTYAISRSTTIAAPAARVHALVEDLHEWRRWSPWEDLDPNLQRTYSGAEKGEGARYAWQGNKKAGQGTMNVVSARPERIEIEVSFIKPFKSTSTSTFTLTPHGEQTEVTWQMSGNQNALMSLVGKVFSMDKMMGPDLEKGLRQLKATAEA